MVNINLGRVLLGGLVTGAVVTFGEYLLAEKVLKTQMNEFFTSHGFKQPGWYFKPSAVALNLVLGIVMVWLYALIRPRLGPGPKTAVIVALIAWFAIYVYTGIINGMALAIPANLLVIALAWGLVEYALAALAGAWLYTEA